VEDIIMYCPNCKAEYREGFTFCPECKCSLVDELPEDPREQVSAETLGTEFHVSEKYVVLLEDTSDNEAFYLIPLLESFGIPTHKVYTGCSDVLKLYAGGAAFGVNILVPESRLEEARALLEANIDWDEVSGADEQ
jgi:hypothetical protein